MSEQQVEKKAGYNWSVLLLVIAAVGVWMVWNHPRIGWSLEVEPGVQLTADDIRPENGFGKEINRC